MKLEDLNLDDSGPSRRDDLAIARRLADRFAWELRQMEDDPKYAFAWGTIVDIRVSVEKSERVTAGQRQAIHNIQVGAQRHEDQKEGWARHERRTGRRYEGWTDGRD